MTKTTKTTKTAKNGTKVAKTPTPVMTRTPAKKPKPPKKATQPAPPPRPVPGPGEIAVSISGDGAEEQYALVKATRVSDYFAVHPPAVGASGKKTGTVLTHVPTGRKVSTYRTRTIATFVATQLRALGGDELWNFSDANHMAKHADKALLAKVRAAASEWDVEDRLKAANAAALAAVDAQKPGLALKPPTATAGWRGGVDWVAAGKKAYETRMRNLAAKNAATTPPLPVPPVVEVVAMAGTPGRATRRVAKGKK